MTKLKNSKYDITQRLKKWQKKLKMWPKSKCDKNQKLKMWRNTKTQNVIKLKNFKGDKIKNSTTQIQPNQKKNNLNKTKKKKNQIVTNHICLNSENQL